MIAPNSNIYLIKTPMELSDLNTLSFSNETTKYNYFQSLPKINLDNATYQRKDGVLRYPTNTNLTYEDIIQYNYCMYQNTSYDTKWFYAYITDVKYINDGMVEISLKTDAFITWQNDIVYKQSFIERQHVADDTVGKNTIKEDVELGDYIVDNRVRGRSFKDTNCVVLGTVLDLSVAPKITPNNPYSFKSGSQLGGVYGGVTYYTFSSLDILNLYLASIMMQGQQEGIITLFMSDSDLFSTTAVYTDTNYTVYEINDTYNHSVISWEVTGTEAPLKPTTIDGYTPKNNKLLTYPFCFIYADNNCGSSATYKYELFTDRQDNKVLFSFYSVVCPGMDMKLVPLNYGGQADAYNEGLVLGKFPICSWLNDSYINTLTQQAINNSDSRALLDYVMNPYKYYPSKPPQIAGNTNSGSVAYGSNHITVDLFQMSIKEENARIIDDYFTKFGYRVDRLETINIHKRTYFDYIKTNGCNITGNIPQKDLEEIRSLFDNGLTIWHNTNYFLDYSVNNAIL